MIKNKGLHMKAEEILFWNRSLSIYCALTYTTINKMLTINMNYEYK